MPNPTYRSSILIDPEQRSRETLCLDAGIEDVLPAPDFMGDGCLRALTLSDEVRYMIPRTAQTPRQERSVVEIGHDASLIGICFALEIGEGSRARRSGSKSVMEFVRGRIYANSPHAEVRHELPESGNTWLVDLFVAPDMILGDYARTGFEPPPEIWKLAREPAGETSLVCAPFGPWSAALARRLDACPYEGALGRLYQEGAILDLIVDALAHISPGSVPPVEGSPDDKKMREAREILDASSEGSFTLGGLARELGISVSKLKRDFPRMNGCTVSGYLVDKRLSRARSLLLDSEMSMKEIAFAIGYRSQSHFSQAYRGKFGETPTLTRRRVRR